MDWGPLWTVYIQVVTIIDCKQTLNTVLFAFRNWGEGSKFVFLFFPYIHFYFSVIIGGKDGSLTKMQF